MSDLAASRSAHTDWMSRIGFWPRFAIAMLAGAAMTAGHPPVGVPWTLFFAMPIVVWLCAGAPTARAAALVGWAAGFGYFVTGLHWISHAFLVEPDKFALLIPLGATGLPAGLALFWAIAVWLAWRISPRGACWHAVTLTITLSAAETARSYVLTGFPWALPGYVWIDTPAMQAAAWAGPLGMTFLTLLLCALPVVAAVDRRFVISVVSIATGAAIWLTGAARMPETVLYADDAPMLRLVQPNAPQALKWTPGHRDEFYRRLIEATREDAAQRPDIVIWPETAVTFLPVENPDRMTEIADAAGGATVIFGALHRESRPGEEIWTNALFTQLPDGRFGPRYDKHHLVPFGEYLPLAGLLGKLGLSQFAQRGGFSEGPGPETMSLPGIPPFSPLICYEAVFAYETVAAERPAWLLQLTNDAWFGTYAGPQQHLAQARIRAIEQGLPMIRAANTGISAVVSPHGEVVVSISMHNYGYLDQKLPAPLTATIYSRTGDWPAIILIGIMLSLISFFRLYTRKG